VSKPPVGSSWNCVKRSFNWMRILPKGMRPSELQSAGCRKSSPHLHIAKKYLMFIVLHLVICKDEFQNNISLSFGSFIYAAHQVFCVAAKNASMGGRFCRPQY